MNKSLKIFLFIFIFASILGLFISLINNGNVVLLNPQGTISDQQSTLLELAIIIAIFIGIPVVCLTIFVALRYKEGDEKKIYAPDWVAGKGLTFIWWLIPAVIVLFWSITGWQYAHNLDPYKPINSSVKPINIQVVSLRWKWLFIYPQQRIATINYLEIPANTPINFQLTSDAPMNSFWIPSLGGQIYTMTGMVTQLNLMADKYGRYNGGGAEMSGDGFAGMNFPVISVPRQDFNNWIQTVKASSENTLSVNIYNDISKPSSYNKETFYSSIDENIFNMVITKYMAPQLVANL